MKNLIFGFILLFAVIDSNGQSFISLRDSFLFYEYSDTIKANEYLKSMHQVALKSKTKEFLVEYYLLKGWFAQDHAEFYKAIDYLNKSASLAKKHGYLQREADAYGNISNVYDDLSDDVKRMEYQQLSLQICEKILNSSKDSTELRKAMAGKSAALGNISFLYNEMGQTEKAIQLIYESMKLDSIVGNYDFLATSYSMLGNIYKAEKRFDESMVCLRKCIAIRQKLFRKDGSNVDEGLYQAYHNVGNVFKDLGQLDSAEFYFQISHKLSQEVGDKLNLTFVYSSLGDIQFLKGNYKRALEYHLKSYQLSNEIESYERIKISADYLSEVYRKMNDYSNAFKYLTISNRYRDSLFNADRMRDLGRAEVNYQFKFKSSLDSLNYSKSLEEKEKLRKAENEKHEAEAATRNFILFGVIFILIVVLFFSVYLIRLYRGKKRAHEIITEQKKITDHHLEIIAEKQKEIVDSINYAKRIQYALLAHREIMDKYLPEHFVLFRPKDIVSGDFYWFTHFKDERNEFSFLAVCDSTGHGVPGAFMSLLNISFINESINEKNILEPNLIFNHVRNRLVQNLGKEGQNDGFDGILLRLNHRTGKMDYAASNNSPILVNELETTVLPCDKMPVGKGELSSSFELFEIPTDISGILYLPTDGYSDQFGGEKGKKLKFSTMLKYFKEINTQPIAAQEGLLVQKFEAWKGELEQLDDVCIIGIQVSALDKIV